VITRPVLCRSFIGRREELAFLHEKRREAGSAHGSLVLVSGEAGLGKSRLVSEFCSSLAYSRRRIAVGPCTEFSGRPYGPILEIVRSLEPGFSGLVPAASRLEQLDVLTAALTSAAARKASIVVVEDLHWADAATLDLLAHVGPKLARLRLLVVATYRPDALHPGNSATTGIAKIARSAQASRIDLAPLAGVDLRTFIDDALSGLSLPDAIRHSIARTGEGNPFFTEELLANALARGRAISGGGSPELPHTVRATLLERIEPFGETERRIIAQAAVIGRTFNLALLATTLESDASSLLPTLRRARDIGLVEELAPDTFRFRHGLTREAIYRDFLGSEVRPLHRTVAQVLERAPEDRRWLEGLAYHWWAAGDAERSLRYNELAGDAAGRVHAHEDAIAFYERALEADGIGAIARAGILEKVAERRIALTWTEEAHATYATAADLFFDAGDREREAGCRAQAALLAYLVGMPSPTAPLEAMLARLDENDYLARSRIHLGLAWLTATFWFPTRAQHHLDQVDTRALTAVADIGLRFHNVSAWVAMTFGDLERFRHEFEAWVAAARETGTGRTHVAALLNGAMCYSFFGLHEDALGNIERAFRVTRESPSRYGDEQCNAFAALCHLASGNLKEARAAIERVPPATENHVNFTFATAWGTIVGAYLDDREMIAKWFDGFDDVAGRALEIECGAGFAEILVRRNKHDEAAALLHRVLPDCELPRGNVYTFLAVGRYGRPADRTRARAYLARAADAASELPERPALALFDALECRRHDRADEARALAREAAAGFRRVRMPLLEAAALEVAGDDEAALAIYRRHGAVYDVRRLSRGPAVEDPSFAPLNHDATALSRREREVASLAAHGHSNLEIARELSISHKTVEKHLASVFAKLGISSRRQLRVAR
jgi:DNA-binding CsgD family transcriptional regulator